MPGPGNKHKSKAKRNTKANADSVQASLTSQPTRTEAPPAQCLTLEEDELTRCGQPATEGYPKPDRCKVHHGQYRTLYKKYKDASKVVDEVKHGAELPTQEQIDRYTDWRAALEKARWVRKYLEAIRVEKTGREIHQRRFFLKGTGRWPQAPPQAARERAMVRAVDVLDALQGRAYQLYQPDGTPYAMNNPAPSTAEVDLEVQHKLTTKEILECIRNPDAFCDLSLRILKKKALPVPTTLGIGDEDLIHLSLRNQKEHMIRLLKPFLDLESYIEFYLAEDHPRPETEHSRSMVEKKFLIQQQFTRRIIFHQPTLFMKSLERVSFKDLILSDDFSMEDIFKFLQLFLRPLAFPLQWLKDAVLDALAITRHGTAANIGNVENRFPLLGGWVFNRAHTVNMPNEAWWHLLTTAKPPGNVENRFVRLCNNFDDLVGFLSFGTLGFVPSPNFCITPAYFDSEDFEDCNISRGHLSLSGIVVADMVGMATPPSMCRPIRTTRKATKRGYITWAEAETRAYMFGAVRNEPDAFVDAFLRELRARPDLFQVVLRSETDPGRQVEMFGSGPSNNDALPATRARQFEAPPSPLPSPPSTRGKWEVLWSATDVLYGSRTNPEMKGYLTILEQGLKGWLFRFKKFPVRYFVILDTVPHRDKSVLARNVSWAALRAGGYAEGEYTLHKYAVASDKLFDRCSQERLGWMPKEMVWKMMRMEDQINARGL